MGERLPAQFFPRSLITTDKLASVTHTNKFPADLNIAAAGKWVTVLLTNTSADTWTPPVFPTMLFVTAIAGGAQGGGKAAGTTARGGGGGGSGHYCFRRPMWINDGTALHYQCGPGGTGGATTGVAGAATYFGNDKSSGYDGPGYIYLLGGTGGQAASVSDGGAGGGWGPATAPTSVAAAAGHACRLQIYHWNGAAGGCGGETSVQTSGLAGELEAMKSAPAGAAAAGSGGGGPGGTGFGQGAAGTTGVAGTVAGIAGSSYGSGGSGANGAAAGARVGGDGAQGAIWIEYWDPNGDATHGWIYQKLGGTAATDASNFTPAYGTATSLMLRLFGVAAGGSAGGRSNATTNTPGGGGSGEYICDFPYQYIGTPVSYSIPGETAKPAVGDNNGVAGGTLTWGSSNISLLGGAGGTRAGVRTGGAGGGRNGGTGGPAGGAVGGAAGIAVAPNSNPAGIWTNGGSGGGGGNTGATNGGHGGPCEGSRSADGGLAGVGPGSPGGGVSWMGTGGLGLNYNGAASTDGNDATAPGAGGGGCVGVNGVARAGGKGGPGCLIVMYWVDY